MADIALALYWHQHQPYYPDDVTGENPMPWVRLHGVKDYWGMAMHLLEYPEMRCTINFVPSLLVQIQAYTEHGASDQFLDVSRRSADGLAEADALFLLDHFFMANLEQMIRPHPRYFELHQRRAAGSESAGDVVRRFNSRDFRDLQVWFNLAWIHPLAIDRDQNLQELQTKGRHFSEADKVYVLGKHQELLSEVIPLHRKLAATGQVELTTTPFYHPILPLLWDKKLAREAMPHVRLPQYSGGYPEDAAVHVHRAMKEHMKVFASPARGMWPAEGSVCHPMLPLLAEHGIEWLATDEEILSHSTQGFVSRDSRGHVNNPERMYRPYRVEAGSRQLGVVFRDHALSDMIGFHYQRSEPSAAADDFVARLRGIGQAIASESPALVSVILDGENCWEHYPGGGVSFLRGLYQRCTSAKDIRPWRIGEFLERHPPRDSLPRLFAGSWINHDFAIWIGHEEDNTAWDALHRTREYLKQREGDATAVASSASTDFRKAWEEIYIAEGSDWFWWYGDEHSSAQDELFDRLFRKHLQNVYQILGDVPPPDLARPIKLRTHRRAIHTYPLALLDVKINGRTTFFEWASAGRYACINERGTMATGMRGPITNVYFGFNLRDLFVRVDFHAPAREVLPQFDTLRIGFAEPSGWELNVHYPARRQQVVRWMHDGTEVSAPGLQVAIDQIVECALGFDRLALGVDQPLQFFVELLEGRQSRDRAPREGTIALRRPSPDFERIMWDV